MPHTSRIPTPFKQHLYRFRLGILPVVTFVVCSIVTVWLWERQAHRGQVVGEVEATVLDVTSGVEGRLVGTPERPYWEIFDAVSKGDVIAYLDDSAIKAQMRTVQAEAAKLMSELDAAKANLELNQLNVLQSHQREVVRLQWERERRNIEYLQTYASVASMKAELEDIDRTLNSLQRGPGLMDVSELKRRQEILRTQMAANRPLLEELKKQLSEADSTLQQHPDLQLAEIETVLAPIRSDVQVQEAVLGEIQVQLDNLVIRAPADGVISVVHRYPGQRVLAGDPIVSIARPHSSYVISYVREQQQIGLYEGMKVGLRLRTQPGSPEYTSSVETVGPQVTPVPPHQLSDQAVPEWATPIRIPIPPQLQQQDLRPGQLVHVIFRSSGESQ